MATNNNNKQPLLFTPITIGNVTVKNRIVISPMCQYSAVDGFANDWHLVHLGARAIGGAGIVMMEATGVEERGRITEGCPGIWKDEHVPKLKQITDFIKSQGSVPAIQLAHAGRKAGEYKPWLGKREHMPLDQGGWLGVAPSALAYNPEKEPTPLEATLEDINQIKKAFVNAVLRAIKAGFQIVELHFAHGYLVQSFLSAYSNKRTDQYGGSFENRIRLAVETIRDIKAAIPSDYPLFVRISCEDYAPAGEGGWDLAQSIELAKRFKELGVYLIDSSSGGNVNTPISSHHGNVNQIPYAERIQREVGIPTGAVGLIVNAQWAEKILQENKATLIFVGRIALDDANWPLHAALELGAQHTIPGPYIWAIGPQTSGKWRQTALVEQNSKQLTGGA